jgi:hypothetical protein
VEWWWCPSNHGRHVHSADRVRWEWLTSHSLHITRLCLTIPHHLLYCAGNRQ